MKRAAKTTQATSASTPPFPGVFWPEQQGYYAGIVLGDDRATAWHLILPIAPECDFEEVVWGDRGQFVPGAMNRFDGYTNTLAMAEAGCDIALKIRALVGDCYLPSRGESALMYASLPDQFKTDSYYWTSTQFSANSGFDQFFYYGAQHYFNKKSEARARAVRRLVLQSVEVGSV